MEALDAQVEIVLLKPPALTLPIIISSSSSSSSIVIIIISITIIMAIILIDILARSQNSRSQVAAMALKKAEDFDVGTI